jgi:hypothetical protein
LSAPFYARNIVEFGNPFELSRGRVSLEARQEPGERQVRAPRGHPYGVGDGLRPAARRFLLELGDDAIALYRPSDG